MIRRVGLSPLPRRPFVIHDAGAQSLLQGGNAVASRTRGRTGECRAHARTGGGAAHTAQPGWFESLAGFAWREGELAEGRRSGTESTRRAASDAPRHSFELAATAITPMPLRRRASTCGGRRTARRTCSTSCTGTLIVYPYDRHRGARHRRDRTSRSTTTTTGVTARAPSGPAPRTARRRWWCAASSATCAPRSRASEGPADAAGSGGAGGRHRWQCRCRCRCRCGQASRRSSTIAATTSATTT